MAKKRDLEVVELEVSNEQAPLDLTNVATHALSPDVVSDIIKMFFLADLSAAFEEFKFDVTEELRSILLYADPNDPSGYTLTSHPAWRDRFNQDCEAHFAYLNELSIQALEAQKEYFEQQEANQAVFALSASNSGRGDLN
jgi:hypothetical protein